MKKINENLQLQIPIEEAAQIADREVFVASGEKKRNDYFVILDSYGILSNIFNRCIWNEGQWGNYQFLIDMKRVNKFLYTLIGQFVQAHLSQFDAFFLNDRFPQLKCDGDIQDKMEHLIDIFPLYCLASNQKLNPACSIFSDFFSQYLFRLTDKLIKSPAFDLTVRALFNLEARKNVYFFIQIFKSFIPDGRDLSYWFDLFLLFSKKNVFITEFAVILNNFLYKFNALLEKSPDLFLNLFEYTFVNQYHKENFQISLFEEYQKKVYPKLILASLTTKDNGSSIYRCLLNCAKVDKDMPKEMIKYFESQINANKTELRKLELLFIQGCFEENLISECPQDLMERLVNNFNFSYDQEEHCFYINLFITLANKNLILPLDGNHLIKIIRQKFNINTLFSEKIKFHVRSQYEDCGDKLPVNLQIFKIFAHLVKLGCIDKYFAEQLTSLVINEGLYAPYELPYENPILFFLLNLIRADLISIDDLENIQSSFLVVLKICLHDDKLKKREIAINEVITDVENFPWEKVILSDMCRFLLPNEMESGLPLFFSLCAYFYEESEIDVLHDFLHFKKNDKPALDRFLESFMSFIVEIIDQSNFEKFDKDNSLDYLLSHPNLINFNQVLNTLLHDKRLKVNKLGLLKMSNFVENADKAEFLKKQILLDAFRVFCEVDYSDADFYSISTFLFNIRKLDIEILKEINHLSCIKKLLSDKHECLQILGFSIACFFWDKKLITDFQINSIAETFASQFDNWDILDKIELTNHKDLRPFFKKIITPDRIANFLSSMFARYYNLNKHTSTILSCLTILAIDHFIPESYAQQVGDFVVSKIDGYNIDSLSEVLLCCDIFLTSKLLSRDFFKDRTFDFYARVYTLKFQIKLDILLDKCHGQDWHSIYVFLRNLRDVKEDPTQLEEIVQGKEKIVQENQLAEWLFDLRKFTPIHQWAALFALFFIISVHYSGILS